MLYFWLFWGCRSETKIQQEDDIGDTIVDGDGDGFDSESDCNDQDASISPNANELCDGIDNNCDGEIDENVRTSYYRDEDQDGYGNPEDIAEACQAPEGYVIVASDCDDTNPDIFAGATEECDGLDNDCNNEVDEGLEIELYLDSDGDGFGDASQAFQGCDPELGLSLYSTDCNDQDASISPNANEICDGIDNNCDFVIDEDVQITYYEDFDNDGFGNPDIVVQACVLPEGYVTNALDCVDVNSEISPISDEFCDEVDNDCDGLIDEDASIDAHTFYLDSDADGYGIEGQTTTACYLPTGYSHVAGDCDDTSADIAPNKPELCDEVDNNCDGVVNESTAQDAPVWYQDADGDGFGTNSFTLIQCSAPASYVSQGGDCNDAQATVYPNANEVCDSFDNDCDGLIDDADNGIDASTQSMWYLDSDGDGFGDSNSMEQACVASTGYIAQSGDCDDSSFSIHPNAIELCDDIDNDCDSLVDDADDSLFLAAANRFYEDSDGDGYGNLAVSMQSCVAMSGYVADNSDCDDTDTAEHPQVNWYADVDADGFGSGLTNTCQRLNATDVANNTDCDDDDNTVYPSAPEACDDIDHNCDGAIDSDIDGDGYSSAACGGLDCNDSDANLLPEENGGCAMGESCLDVLEAGMSYGDNLYLIDPDGFATGQDPLEVYCDMSTDGGGWMLVARSHPGADSSTGTWGWFGAPRGYVYDFTQAYNIGFKSTLFDYGFDFTEVMFGNRDNVYTNDWGPFIYKYEGIDTADLMASTSEKTYVYSTVQADISIWNYSSAPNMQRLLGFAEQGTTSSTSIFYMRDCCGYSNYGAAAFGMQTTYINHSTSWYYAGPWGVQTDAYASNGDFVQLGDTASQPKWGGTRHYMIFVR